MIYSESEIVVLRTGGALLANILKELIVMVRPGVTTVALDDWARIRILELGGEPCFLGYTTSGAATPFPSALCTSVNDEVVHAPAIPARTLQSGDIVGLDIGMRYPASDGLCTDMAVTVGVGKVSASAQRLMTVTQEALRRGIAVARAGKHIRDISHAIQSCVERAGFNVVRDLVGHGVGRAVHEPPEVPNYIVPGPIGDVILESGLVIAIEPMVNAGRSNVTTRSDGWTVRTRDGSLSAHFEHTVVVTADGVEILTQLS